MTSTVLNSFRAFLQAQQVYLFHHQTEQRWLFDDITASFEASQERLKETRQILALLHQDAPDPSKDRLAGLLPLVIPSSLQRAISDLSDDQQQQRQDSLQEQQEQQDEQQTADEIRKRSATPLSAADEGKEEVPTSTE